MFRIEINMVRIMLNGEFKYYLAHWNDITEREKVQEILLNHKVDALPAEQESELERIAREVENRESKRSKK